MKKILSVILVSAFALSLAGCTAEKIEQSDETINVAGLKGPTTMGMAGLIKESQEQNTQYKYDVQTYGTADEIVPKLLSGEIDVASVPANLAAVLYAKSQGALQVAAVNTLGVMYIVENGESITDFKSLEGKTIMSTGKGTTPEYVLNYLIEKNSLSDVKIEYKSEATEIAAALAEGTEKIALLPQPYVTVAKSKIPTLRVALDLSEEWDKASGGLQQVTGVVLARKDFINEDEKRFTEFLKDYKKSTVFVNDNTAKAAEIIADKGIIATKELAEKAIPECNIVWQEGEEMRTNLSEYLTVLEAQNPKSVGGSLPNEDFYYIAE